MNNFLSEIGPDLENISGIEKQSKKRTKDIKIKSNKYPMLGLIYGGMIGIAGCNAVASATSASIILLTLILPPLIGFSIGKLLVQAYKKLIEQEIKRTEREAKKLKTKVKEFMEKYYL